MFKIMYSQKINKAVGKKNDTNNKNNKNATQRYILSKALL